MPHKRGSSLGHDAAINDNRRAGNKGGFGRSKKEYSLSNLFGLSHTVKGYSTNKSSFILRRPGKALDNAPRPLLPHCTHLMFQAEHP